jgi:putative methylase
MSTKTGLAQQLGVVAGFDDPRVDLEQYRTPPDLAAHLVHTADLNGDIEGRTVVDLGTGTGMLALAAGLRGPTSVVGVDVDPVPLATARENEGRVAAATGVEWVLGDATQLPLDPEGPTTVVMNPPFGAQASNEHADAAVERNARSGASPTRSSTRAARISSSRSLPTRAERSPTPSRQNSTCPASSSSTTRTRRP